MCHPRIETSTGVKICWEETLSLQATTSSLTLMSVTLKTPVYWTFVQMVQMASNGKRGWMSVQKRSGPSKTSWKDVMLWSTPWLGQGGLFYLLNPWHCTWIQSIKKPAFFRSRGFALGSEFYSIFTHPLDTREVSSRMGTVWHRNYTHGGDHTYHDTLPFLLPPFVKGLVLDSISVQHFRTVSR